MNTVLDRRGHIFTATSSMLIGPLLVFGLVVLMNNLDNGINKQSASLATQVEVIKSPKPKPKKKRHKPKSKPKRQRMKTPEPFKGLNTALSGIDLDLPGLMTSDMNQVDSHLLGSTKNSVMTEDLVDVAPKPRRRSAFKYPHSAKKKGITGYVLVALLIDRQGKVEQVQMIESSPAGVFDDVVLVGIRNWQFEPAQYQGKAVKVWAKQKIRLDFS